jgi:outer membrane immunogenic protein
MRKCVFAASRVAFACVLSAAASIPAGAADLDNYDRRQRDYGDDPIVVPRSYFSWTGFYIGGHLGYGWGSSSSTNLPDIGNGDAFDGADGFAVQPYGWLAGVSVGYNWQYDHFVFGLEADLGYLGADDTQENALAFTTVEYGAYGTLTGRVGYAEDRWLFYAKGGLAFANIENTAGAFTAGDIDPSDFTNLDETRAGWALGAGVEYAFQRDLSMKIEYLYMDFGADRSSNFDGDRFEHENDIHTIKVGLNYSLQRIYEPLK